MRLNVNLLKDGVSNDLARDIPGAGYMHFPIWAEDELFSELTAEVRGAKGWEKRHGVSNETLDLCVYARAGCVMLRAENIDWSMPPTWATDTALQKAVTVNRSVALGNLARSLNG